MKKYIVSRIADGSVTSHEDFRTLKEAEKGFARIVRKEKGEIGLWTCRALSIELERQTGEEFETLRLETLV